MKTSWNPEIEKKYQLKDGDKAREVVNKAHRLDLVEESWVFQKDWIPDFEDFSMKKMGVLLRVRTMEYLSGVGPKWLITLKIKQKENGVHHNRELEISSDDNTNAAEVTSFMKDNFGIELDLERLADLDKEYTRSIGLTEHRMYIEKRRRQYYDSDEEIVLAVDELPKPAGWFVEIELNNATDFSEWESALGLNDTVVEERDYGEIVKELTSKKPKVQQRQLAFT